MSFQLFLDSIEADALRVIACHWDRARGDRVMPVWRDIDPLAIAPQLPIVWSWRWRPERDEFVGRLAGDEIERVLGGSVRGRILSDVLGTVAAPGVLSCYRDIVGKPALVRGTGRIYARIGGGGFGERIILPLGADGSDAGGVLGATVYRFTSRNPGSDLRIDFAGETREMFPLEAAAATPLVA